MKNIKPNKNPKIVFSDFDGTLTDHTEFSVKFVEIIKLLKQKNIPLIIVTGRSVSWAHFFLTHFSDLDYVISEGGGILSLKNEKGLIENIYQIDSKHPKLLRDFCTLLSEKYPDLELSADSVGRITDRAIELCLIEDLSFRKEIMNLMDEHHINYSTSNVHLNFWSGEISKFNASKNLMNTYFKGVTLADVCYFGDSLNDQSMFEKIENSIGVSNIKSVLHLMKNPPKIILEGVQNAGPSGVLSYLQNLIN